MDQDVSGAKFDIVISIGQSSCAEWGWGPTPRPYEPDDNVWFLNGNLNFTVAKEDEYEPEQIPQYIKKHTDIRKLGNIALSFAREYIEGGLLQPGRKLLIIRNHTDGRWDIRSAAHALMMRQIETAMGLNPENRLIAVMWSQGESYVMGNNDVRKSSCEEHMNRLLLMMNTIRETFDAPGLPVLLGEMVYEFENMTYTGVSAPITKAERDACKWLGHARFVESYGLQCNGEAFGDFQGDHLHLCRDALYKFGVRHYKAYKEIVRG